MPLSEEELRLLEQMERALSQEDPKFASTLRGRSAASAARRRAIGAGVVFLGGVAILMTGAITGYILVGVLGFLVMLASATMGLTALRARQGSGSSGPQLSLRDRLEGRLRRRHDEDV